MAFTKSWVETDPDGSVITVSQLDNYQRDAKIAIRERLEGDPAVPDLTGLIESGSFTSAPKPRKGAARVYVDTDATILAYGVTKREDGRLAVASDTRKLYHVAGAAVVAVVSEPQAHVHATADITSGTFADARIAQSNVTQHQAALVLATSQITTGTFADALIAQSNVTQHQAALAIAETQITDGSLLARLAANESVTGSWTFAPSSAVTAIAVTQAVGARGIVIAGGTQTTEQAMLDLAQTWNNAGTVFRAIKVAVTNTASNASSMLVEMKVGAPVVFSVDRNGLLTSVAASFSVTSGAVIIGSDPGGTEKLRVAGDVRFASDTFLDGHIFFATDNSFDVGAVGQKPRSGYFGTSVVIGSSDPGGSGRIRVNQPAGSAGVFIAGGTQTTSQPALEITQTWNAVGVAFEALKVNITNTTSAAGSLIANLQVGGTTRVSVNKTGLTSIDPDSNANFALELGAGGQANNIRHVTSVTTAAGGNSYNVDGKKRYYCFEVTSGTPGTVTLNKSGVTDDTYEVVIVVKNNTASTVTIAFGTNFLTVGGSDQNISADGLRAFHFVADPIGNSFVEIARSSSDVL